METIAFMQQHLPIPESFKLCLDAFLVSLYQSEFNSVTVAFGCLAEEPRFKESSLSAENNVLLMQTEIFVKEVLLFLQTDIHMPICTKIQPHYGWGRQRDVQLWHHILISMLQQTDKRREETPQSFWKSVLN